jgi:hypothetical protein
MVCNYILVSLFYSVGGTSGLSNTSLPCWEAWAMIANKKIEAYIGKSGQRRLIWCYMSRERRC